MLTAAALLYLYCTLGEVFLLGHILLSRNEQHIVCYLRGVSTLNTLTISQEKIVHFILTGVQWISYTQPINSKRSQNHFPSTEHLFFPVYNTVWQSISPVMFYESRTNCCLNILSEQRPVWSPNISVNGSVKGSVWNGCTCITAPRTFRLKRKTFIILLKSNIYCILFSFRQVTLVRVAKFTQ